MTRSERLNSPTTRSTPTEPHRVLLLVALALTTAAALVIGWYALRVGSLLLICHAGQLAVVAVSFWSAFDAEHIRRLMTEASGVETTNTAVDAGGIRPDEDIAKAHKRLERKRRQATEAQSLHVIYLAVPVAAIAFFAVFQGWRLGFAPIHEIPVGFQTTLGLLSIALSIVWLVLSNTLAAIRDEEMPEASALARALREVQWSAWLVAGSFFAGTAMPQLAVWSGRGLCLWLILVCIEQLSRTAWTWIAPTQGSDSSDPSRLGEARFMSPINLLLREAFLVRANPLASLFDVLEQRFGVNFRASWAITFVRQVTVPLLLLLIILGWLVTAFQVVEPHQFAVEERLGRTAREPLTPGLHVTLPWPLTQVRRFPVKSVAAMQIGFKDKATSGASSAKIPQGFDPDSPRALLWTQAHDEEFALVLGNGSEVVAVNAVVYHKIHEDRDRFFDYVYRSQNPETALEALAYRTLLELTRSATLNDVLTADRAGFANRFRDTLRRYSEQQRLGIDVVDVAIINLHPPVEAAADYLDVISAKLDASRVELEASGFRAATLLTTEAESLGLTASAKIDAARRVSIARAESIEFLAAESARRASPQTYSLRLWIEVLEQNLKNKRLFLVEKSLLENSDNVWLDLRPGTAVSPLERLPHGK
jgi:regulator of protease activity HflC (stomatin/prohibitin superfamily)